MKAIKIRTWEQPEDIWQGVIRCPQGKLKPIQGMPPFRVRNLQWGRLQAFKRKTTTLHPSQLTMHTPGGRDCILMCSWECNEYVSKFLSTIDFLLVQHISVAHFFLMVYKLGGAIPFAPSVCAALIKHTWFYNYFVAIEFDSAHQACIFMNLCTIKIK